MLDLARMRTFPGRATIWHLVPPGSSVAICGKFPRPRARWLERRSDLPSGDKLCYVCRGQREGQEP